MPKGGPQEPDLHQLTDIDVITVGLVTHGANQEDFFIRKEANMPGNDDALLIEQAGTDQAQAGLIAKLRALFRQDIDEALEKAALNPKAHQAMTRACKELMKAEEYLSASDQKMLARMKRMTGLDQEGAKEPGGDNAPEENQEPAKPEGYGYPAPGKPPVKKDDSPVAPVEEDVKKEEPVTKETVTKSEVTVAIPPEVTAKLEALQKSAERVEALEAELAKAREAETKATFVQKAASVPAVPTSTETLAEQLMFIAKQDQARADWWLALLKAVDHQLQDAGLFTEKGAAASPEDKTLLEDVAKAGGTTKQAMLTMPAERAAEYLTERRFSIRTGR